MLVFWRCSGLCQVVRIRGLGAGLTFAQAGLVQANQLLSPEPRPSMLNVNRIARGYCQ